MELNCLRSVNLILVDRLWKGEITSSIVSEGNRGGRERELRFKRSRQPTFLISIVNALMDIFIRLYP